MKGIRALVLVIALLVPAVSAQSGDVTIPNTYVYYEFDKPKGPGVTFTEELALFVWNLEENTTLHVTGLSASASGVQGAEVSLDRTSFDVPGVGSQKVYLNVTIPASTGEGKHYLSLEISGSGVPTETFNITLEVRHPPATIEASWDTPEWGDVKAGSNFTRTLKLLEVMGYRDAGNVSLRLEAGGPITLDYERDIGDIPASTLKSVEVRVSVPERGVTPGTYQVSPLITAGGDANVTAEKASYEIPLPEMVLESSTLDFGQITFETGKDFSRKSLVIEEAGGFTPIENLSISLQGGEEGWVTYSSHDYIAPGAKEEFVFSVYLPQDARLGKREWSFTIDTAYAGSQTLRAVVQVYFPGIDEAVRYLDERPPVEASPQTGTLIRETLNLLEAGRDKTEIKKIAMVMSVYSGTRSFLNLLEEAYRSMEKGDLSRAGDLVIAAHDSLNKIRIGNSNIYDADLKLYSSSVEDLAQRIWVAGAEDVLDALVEEAGNSEETDYKSAALYYERASRIYALLGDADSAREFEDRRARMERRYTQSLEEASALKMSADEKLSRADEKMFVFEDAYLVLNPFNYEEVSALYAEAIEEYAAAGERYRVAGELKEAQVSQEYARKLEERKEAVFRAFVVYGLFWSLVFLWLVARITLGFQRFRQDELDGLVGDVVVRKDRLEEAEA
ncbi:MAG: hypothetical protein GXO65_00425 [Euryarchaeota archaeon]|nr:hypothetical protein [Euryarchaeota archaeon]